MILTFGFRHSVRKPPYVLNLHTRWDYDVFPFLKVVLTDCYFCLQKEFWHWSASSNFSFCGSLRQSVKFNQQIFRNTRGILLITEISSWSSTSYFFIEKWTLKVSISSVKLCFFLYDMGKKSSLVEFFHRV